MSARDEFVTKDDLEKSLGKFKEEIIHEFHIVTEGLMDHIKLLAEGHSGVVQRLDHMEKENERQHMETRSLIKLSFTELDNRLSSLELQVKELQEWRKQVQDRLQI